MMKRAGVLISFLALAGAAARSGEAAFAPKVGTYRGRAPRVTSIGTGPAERLRAGGSLDPDEYRITDARISDARYLSREGKRLRREMRLEREIRGAERAGRSRIVPGYRGRIGREEIKQRKKERLLLF